MHKAVCTHAAADGARRGEITGTDGSLTPTDDVSKQVGNSSMVELTVELALKRGYPGSTSRWTESLAMEHALQQHLWFQIRREVQHGCCALPGAPTRRGTAATAHQQRRARAGLPDLARAELAEGVSAVRGASAASDEQCEARAFRGAKRREMRVRSCAYSRERCSPPSNSAASDFGLGRSVFGKGSCQVRSSRGICTRFPFRTSHVRFHNLLCTHHTQELKRLLLFTILISPEQKLPG